MLVNGLGEIMLVTGAAVWVCEFVFVCEEGGVASGCQGNFIKPSFVTVFVHDGCYREEPVFLIILTQIEGLEIVAVLREPANGGDPPGSCSLGKGVEHDDSRCDTPKTIRCLTRGSVLAPSHIGLSPHSNGAVPTHG